MRARGLTVAVLMTVLGAVSPGRATAQGEIFEHGNQLYQQGDYAGAVEAYKAVLTAGYDGAALHYNLGNAYFKSGDLGHAILEWERALDRAPGDADALANLELARSMTADAVEPRPRFWLFAVVSWWVDLVPHGVLVWLVGSAWLVFVGGVVTRVLARREQVRRYAKRLAGVGAVVVVLFGINLVVRELHIGRPERGVILANEVSVQSAPSDEDDLTLFQIHEGTRVRIDHRTGSWAEIVLEDGKVGWVPSDVMEVI
jgi:tetratricopeptide (TPR) repeat protein